MDIIRVDIFIYVFATIEETMATWSYDDDDDSSGFLLLGHHCRKIIRRRLKLKSNPVRAAVQLSSSAGLLISTSCPNRRRNYDPTETEKRIGLESDSQMSGDLEVTQKWIFMDAMVIVMMMALTAIANQDKSWSHVLLITYHLKTIRELKLKYR